ncbi:MAG: outer membrane lipoprotein carrier protein LolA [Bdellovibrio sp.]|nr:outer membrane lipoprotein carrier protein LolA [Bdellovibrio sp.]
MKFICLFLSFICWTVYAADFMPKAFKAEFDQSFMSVIKKKTVVNHGVLFYQYPGNIRLEITDPDEGLIYVSNPQKSWYYRPPFIPGEPGELSVSPKGNTLVAKFFDGLKNGLKANPLYDVRDLGDKKYEIIFKKNAAKDAGVKKATLALRTGAETLAFAKVDKISLVFTDNKKVDLVFKSLTALEKHPDEVFTFVVPENTNITHQ